MILNSTRAIVFFGAVHRGMEISDIEEYLRDTFPNSSARFRIVEELSVDNESALKELQDFINLSPRFRIISIYERQLARRLIKREEGASNSGPPDTQIARLKLKPWMRMGEPYTPVTESSSVLGLPIGIEITIPSNSDHSNITKFSSRTDGVYQELLKELRKIQTESDLRAFPFTQLLRVDTTREGKLYQNSPPSGYQQRVIPTDAEGGLFEGSLS